MLMSAPMTSPALAFRVPATPRARGLKIFDLSSGALKGSAPLADPKSLCNDIAIGSDGTAYVTDSSRPNVYSLKRAAPRSRSGRRNPMLAPAKDGVGSRRHRVRADGNL